MNPEQCQNGLRHSGDRREDSGKISSPCKWNKRLRVYKPGASVVLVFLKDVGIAIIHSGVDAEVMIF